MKEYFKMEKNWNKSQKKNFLIVVHSRKSKKN